ncbi:hypothetical protein GOB93_14310 [Acetobacter musti]|uniref:Phage protein n=1 Tax=Acetobacter musti TaxID=864732 RepID=A0ABX0JTG5_9PROT|nr:hypothetical protein [Acetobacter musti]NHN85806.1 hypothetical protein [Acetobacter musti]
MPGIWTGDPTQSVQTQALGSDILPTTTSQAVGAGISGAFQNWYEVRGLRGAVRVGDSFSPDILKPEDANKQYGIDGVLSFDKPTTRDVAQELHDEKHAQIVRNDIISSSPTTGLPTSAGILTAFADPVGIAASFVPGLGEARAAAILGRVGIDSSRAARGLSGATQGMAGVAALEPANYMLDQSEHNDWSMGQALTNIGLGGVMGGGLHMILPRAVIINPEQEMFESPTAEQMANPNSGFMESQSPEMRDAALREAIGAQLEDRPNIVAEMAEAHDFAEPSPSAGEVSLRDIAASLDPDTFAAFDKLSGSAADIRTRIEDASQQVFDPTFDEDILADRASHYETQEQIASLERRASSLKSKGAQKVQAQIDDLRSGLSDLEARAQRQTSHEQMHDRDVAISEMRQKLQQIDYQMRDMAPDLHAAYQISETRFRRLARRYQRRNGKNEAGTATNPARTGSVTDILSAAMESGERLKSAARAAMVDEPAAVANSRAATEASVENAPRADAADHESDVAQISADADRIEAEYRALYGDDETPSAAREKTFDEDENAASAYEAAAACLVRGL